MKIKTVLLGVLAVLCNQASLTWGGPVPEAVSKFPSAIPAEYQDAISKVLPGYEILRNEDMLQDESWLSKFLSPDEVAKRKKRESLGFIVGRFNDDKVLDFAAWVVNRSIEQERPDMPKSDIWKGTFAARLVVCLGTNAPREYRCEILPALYAGGFIDLPFWADLGTKLVGEIYCGDQGEPVAAIYPEGWKGKRPSSDRGVVPARKLRPNYDAIVESPIGKNFVSILIRGADGVYLDCSSGD